VLGSLNAAAKLHRVRQQRASLIPNLHYFRFEAAVRPSHPRYGELDGAMINCWVNEPTESLAESAARAEIEAAGWDILEYEESSRIDREDYLKSDSLEYFDQALTDGGVLVVHSWPVGGDIDE
jgi:hypothetical protein